MRSCVQALGSPVVFAPILCLLSSNAAWQAISHSSNCILGIKNVHSVARAVPVPKAAQATNPNNMRLLVIYMSCLLCSASSRMFCRKAKPAAVSTE